MTPRRTRLEALRDRYLAVSLRSRSVRLSRATRSGAIDLTVIEALSPKVFETLVAKLGIEHPTPVPLVDVAPEAPGLARVAQDIATLARAAHTVEMETGAQELAVGWPILEGRARNGTWFRGPLFLYPVSIEQTQTGRLRWAVSFDGPPAFNRTLMELIERHEGVCAPLSLFADMDDDGLYRPDDATWEGFHRAMAVAELGSSEIPTRLPALESLQPRQSGGPRRRSPGLLSSPAHPRTGTLPAVGQHGRARLRTPPRWRAHPGATGTGEPPPGHRRGGARPRVGALDTGHRPRGARTLVGSSQRSEPGPGASLRPGDGGRWTGGGRSTGHRKVSAHHQPGRAGNRPGPTGARGLPEALRTRCGRAAAHASGHWRGLGSGPRRGARPQTGARGGGSPHRAPPRRSSRRGRQVLER